MIALATSPATKPRSIEELTTTVSASRLGAWQRCRLQFFFRYIAGIQKPPTAALHIGSTVHAVLQQWNLARWRRQTPDSSETLYPSAFKEIFDEAWSDQCIEWDDEESSNSRLGVC